MMAAMQGGGGGREAMAMLAARLMGGGTTSNTNSNTHNNTNEFTAGPTSKPKAAPAPSSPTVSVASKATIPAPAPGPAATKVPPPRSVPAPQASNRQPPHLSGAAPQAPASSSTASSPTKDSASAAPVNDGPSLRGSADQLAAAREFMSGATSGNPKSRGSSRGRVLSQEPTRASRPSASTASYAPAVASPRPRPSTTGLTGSANGAGGGTSGGLSQWQALRGQPTPGVASSTNRDSPTKTTTATAAPTIKTEVREQKSLPAFSFGPTATSFSKPSSPVIKKENDSPARAAPLTSSNWNAVPEIPRVGKSAPRQFAEITNILNDRAADVLPRAAKELPPHLRNKQATSSSLETKSAAPQKSETAAATNTTKVEAAVPAEKRIFSFGPEDSIPAKPQSMVSEAFTNGTKPIATGPVLAVKPPMDRKDSAAHISVDSKPTIDGGADASQRKPLTNGSADAAETAGHYDHQVMQELKAEVVAITKRLSGLEKENFSLQKQVETLVQKEERRKFLGTESAMAPFGVDVKGPNGHVVRVQATSALKVGELIRRIRTKANLSPVDSKDPRVTFEEKQLGHGVALGEAGVAANSVLLFTYSG